MVERLTTYNFLHKALERYVLQQESKGSPFTPVAQSTLADKLGAILGIPVIHLDEIFWNPGWVKTPSDAFQERVEARLGSDDCICGWVVDGNYTRRLSGQLDVATDVICASSASFLSAPSVFRWDSSH